LVFNTGVYFNVEVEAMLREKILGLREVGIFTAVLLLFVFMAVPATEAADARWQATYWNNRDLSGDPILVREEVSIDHDWGDDAPHEVVNQDAFSVRWTRSINFAAGTYRFTATTDDGMRVWIDNNQLIDVWYDSQVHSVSADRYLTSGDHLVRVEYYEAGGDAVAQFDWSLIGGFTGDWHGQYFNNISLTGTPALTRNDTQIDFVWEGAPAAQVQPDQFSVRWTRSVPLDAGRYRFMVTADDGVRLWVNNQLIVDQWRAQPATALSAEIDLPGGSIPIQMDYFENGGLGVAALSWTRLTAVPPTPVPQPVTNWRGEYFNNVSLSGSPALVRDDTFVDFIWGSATPAPNIVVADRFSVRWARTLNLSPGRYFFTAHADDGVRLWVNNQLLIDEWHVQPVTSYTAVIDITNSSVPVVMEYFENTGLAEARLTWSAVGAAPEPPPISNTPTATMVGARYLNVRSGPGVEFDAFSYLIAGQTVPLVGRDFSAIWIQIELPDGRSGWVSGRYLSSGYPFANLPVVQ
jgi:hypothetical protein